MYEEEAEDEEEDDEEEEGVEGGEEEVEDEEEVEGEVAEEEEDEGEGDAGEEEVPHHSEVELIEEASQVGIVSCEFLFSFLLLNFISYKSAKSTLAVFICNIYSQNSVKSFGKTGNNGNTYANSINTKKFKKTIYFYFLKFNLINLSHCDLVNIVTNVDLMWYLKERVFLFLVHIY